MSRMTKMSTFRKSMVRRVATHFRERILVGLLVLVPVVITYLVLKLVFDTIDGVLQPAMQTLLERRFPGLEGRRVPGLGVAILVILVYLAGILGSNFIGKRFIGLGQEFLLRLPLVRAIYSPAKQLIESFSGSQTTGFKRVVIIEYPRVGTWTIGFLTGMTKDEHDRPMALVYIPTAPTPNSGWLAIIPAQDVYDTDLSVQEAMSLVFSGGIASPAQLKKKAPVK